MNSRAGVKTYRGKKTSQTLRKEANEGVTYTSSVGLNLNPLNNNKNTSPLAFDLPSDISVNELKRCEELAPHTHQYRKQSTYRLISPKTTTLFYLTRKQHVLLSKLNSAKYVP